MARSIATALEPAPSGLDRIGALPQLTGAGSSALASDLAALAQDTEQVAARLQLLADQCGMTVAVQVLLPHDERAPGMARAAVRDALADTLWHAMVQDIVEAVSELVTNAVLHTDGSQVPLRVYAGPGVVIVEVDDADSAPAGFGASLPARAAIVNPRTVTGLGGLGLYLVASLASRSGQQRFAGGKTVWAAFDRPPIHPAAAAAA